MRTSLPEDHTLFLAYIEDTAAVHPVLPSTVSNWVKNHIKCAGVDIKKYKVHSLRSASSTFAILLTTLNNILIGTIDQIHLKNSTWSLLTHIRKAQGSRIQFFLHLKTIPPHRSVKRRQQRSIYNGQTIRQLPK